MRLNIKESKFTKEEEQEYFKKYYLLNRMIQTAKNEETKQKSIILRDKLRDLIFVKNYGLVCYCANLIKSKTSFMNVDLDDYRQFASIALLKAIENYDIHSGAKFSTYASRVMNSAILRSVNNFGKEVHIPEKVFSEYMVISNKMSDRNKNGEPMDFVNIADEMGRDSQYVGLIVNMFTNQHSQPDDQEIPLVEPKYSNYETETLQEDLRDVLSDLEEFDKSVLIKYYGLFGNPVFSVEDLADMKNVSRQTIYNSLSRSMKMLKGNKRFLKDWENYETD